jgi:large repetitive protein
MNQDELIRELGKVIGLLDADGSFVSSWLSHPFDELKKILTDRTRRAALGRLLDGIVPGPPGDRAGWHPLLWFDGGAPPFGNVYLVFEPHNGETEIAVAGEFHTAAAAPFGFRFDARLPLLRTAGNALASALDGDGGALELGIGLRLPATTAAVRIDEVRARLRISIAAPPAVTGVAVDLVGFRLGTAPPRDLALDVDDLGGEAADLVMAVLHDALQTAPEPFRSHLLPVLGLDPGLPRLSLPALVADGDAVRRWLQALVDGGRLGDWFGHLAALLGAAGSAGPAGTRSDPFVATIIGGNVRLAFTLAVAEGRLYPGVTLRAGAESGVHLAADLVLLGISLRGAAAPELLPEASLTVRSPTPVLAPVLAGDGSTVVAAGGARAGVSLVAGAVVPLLELLDITLAGHLHPRIDLTNLDAVGGLAAEAVEALLVAALGDGPGRPLLALAGVVAPKVAAAPGDVWSRPDRPRLDLVRFLSDPLGAVAAFHREALAADAWGPLLGELVSLFSPAPVTSAAILGAGALADPWRFTLAQSGPLAVRVSAWRSGAATLHVGGELALEEGAFRAAVTSEVVRLTATPAGAPELALLQEHHAAFTVAPIPAGAVDGWARLRADRFSADAHWTVGGRPQVEARLEQVVIEVDGASLPAFDLAFPFAGPPPVDDRVLRVLLARAVTRVAGDAGAALLGLAGVLPSRGLPRDFPPLTGDLQAGLLGLLRPWLRTVVTSASSDGTPHAVAWLRLLAAAATGSGEAAELSPRVLGMGSEQAPWRAALRPDRGLELLLWLEPEPPVALASAILARSGDSGATLAAAALVLRPYLPELAAALDDLDDTRLAVGVERLGDFFAVSDGVVPLASQAPSPFTAGAQVTSTHARVPAVAASAVRAEIAGAPALLLSAPFAGRSSWADLIGAEGSAHFDLRQPGIPPERVDLRAVTAVVPFYTADLSGTDVAALAAQIGLLLARLAELRPGQPLVLVAHSLTGRAAVAAAAAAATGRVQKVITLATPHLGALPPYLDEPASGVALRVARALQAQLPASPVRDALEEAAAAVDDRAPAGAVSALPVGAMVEPAAPPAALPVPVVAISAVTGVGPGASLLAALSGALAAAAPAAAPATSALGAGVALQLDPAVASGQVGARTELRLDLGRVGLAGPAVDEARRRLRVAVVLERKDGWLLGGPGVAPDGTPWPARARRAVLRADWNGSALAVDVELTAAALAGAPRTLGIDGAETPALLDAIFAQLATDPDAAPSVARFLAALRALGVLVPDAPRLAADALTALRNDGAAYLVPRLRAALAAPFYGHDPATGWELGGGITLRLDGERALLRLDHRLGRADVQVALASFTLTGEAALRAAGLELTWRPGSLSAALPPWLAPTPVWPLAANPGDFVPRLVFATVAEALLTLVLPGRPRFPALDALFTLGAGVAPSELVPGAGTLALVLRQLGAALGLPAAGGLLLPPGLLLSAAADGDGRTRLRLATTAPIQGVLGLDLALRFGGRLEVTPSAAITLQVPDPPAASPAMAWRGVQLELTLAGSLGLALRVGATRVELLPSFSGWESLLAGGVALLPRALDEITTRIPASLVKQAVLDVAAACGLYGPPWSADPADYRSLLSWTFDDTQRGRILGAAETLLTRLGLPGGASLTGTVLSWQSPPLPAPVSGTVTAALDWSAAVPTVAVNATLDLTLANPASALDRVALRLALDVALQESYRALARAALVRPLATNVLPGLELGVVRGTAGPEPVLRLTPLAPGETAAGPLAIALLPAPAATLDAAALPGVLALDVLLPLLTALLERATEATAPTALWPGGPTAQELVDASGLFDASHRLSDPRPDLPTVLANVAAALSAEVHLGPLTLTLGDLGGRSRLGVAAVGWIPIPLDAVELGIVLGEGAERSELVLLSRQADGYRFAPELKAKHFGLGVRGTEGKPLISNPHLRLGGGEAFVFFDLAVDPDAGGLDAGFRGAGFELDDLGVSLGATQGGDNAIAAGLLRSASAGDAAPAQPGFPLAVEYVQEGGGDEGGGGGFTLRARLGDSGRRLFIGLHAGFGPLYIDQVGVELEKIVDPGWIRLLVDGGVTVAGFAAQVDDLSLQIPFADAGNTARWAVDLAGLGVSYQGGGVSIRGGLIRRALEPPQAGVEYAGLLQIKIQTLGAVAVGAWSKLRGADAEGDLDSLFVFAAVFVTVSFPPFFELRGLGAGFGYNRALRVPENVDEVPRFALVQVLDDPNAVDRPLELLAGLRTALPARRGSLWFAAGIRGALFVVVDVVAVLYVALDRNFEIGLVGVGRIEQPKGNPILFVEVALKARFSSAEGVLSIQAQLTARSWLLLPECQLTGGFALFIWFPRGKFVFTVGGYHPAFVPEPEFPIVPRLGFRCNLLGVIQLKGESYFALTNSCVMAGTRFEAAYDIGWLRAWFRAWADFLLAWDPFHYDVTIGIELGADFSIKINLLFGSIRVHFSVSVGADLHVVGPPLHGKVRAHLGPISITVPFGSSETGQPPALTWPQFRDRYVLAGDAAAIPVSVQPEDGLAPLAAGARPPEGKTPADAWRFVAEFSLTTTTAMPASKVVGPLGGESAVAGVDVDFGPMHETVVETTHRLAVTRRDGGAVALDADRWRVEQRLGDFPEAVWRYLPSPRAGTNNVRGLAGLTVRTVAEAINPTAAVPILTLVDKGAPRRLPFNSHGSSWRTDTTRIGEAANRFAIDWADVAAHRLLAAGSPAHAGLPFRVHGLAGVAEQALRRRTSPPLVAPLSEGMDLGSPARGVLTLPPRAVTPPREEPLAVLHASRFPAAQKAPVRATRVSRVAAAKGAPRTSPPSVKRSIGHLVRVPTATPETRIVAAVPALQQGPAARRALAALAKEIAGHGIDLGAGAVQLWSLPAGRWGVSLAGDAARVVALARGGKPLVDLESVGPHHLELPARTIALAVWSLGRADVEVQPGLAAVSLLQSPSAPVAVGWHANGHLQVVDPISALGRGASLRLSHAVRGTAGLAPAAGVLREQSSVETTLPAGVTAVLVSGAVTNPTTAALGDLRLGVRGAAFGEPLRFESAGEAAALYPVTAATAAQPFALSVGSLAGFRLTGVAGLRGRVAELAARLHGTDLSRLVADGPLTPHGSVHVTLQPGARP